MPKRDKVEIQRVLLETLRFGHRHAFSGKVALRLVLKTTDPNPTQSHHVAKNLLDLFGAPTYLSTRRSALLYRDDRQVHALSVTSFHGSGEPEIYLEARSLTEFLEDVRLAADFQQDEDQSFHYDEPGESIRDFRKMLADSDRWKSILGGEEAYENMLRFNQRRAQAVLLGQGALSIRDLDSMYNVVRHPFGVFDSRDWFQRMFAVLPIRIRLSGLPQAPGSADIWRAEIDQKIGEFQQKWGTLLEPLVTPIAVEVVIKPPPAGRFNALFDLDNVMRSYVIPRIIQKLQPVSHPSFVFNEPKRQAGLRPEEKLRQFESPPKSSKFGVTRFEAWRLSEAESVAESFVTVAIVADIAGFEDPFSRVSDVLDDWGGVR